MVLARMQDEKDTPTHYSASPVLHTDRLTLKHMCTNGATISQYLNKLLLLVRLTIDAHIRM